VTVRTTIEMTGESELQALIERAVRNLEKPRDLMDAIGGLMEQAVQGRFDSKTDPQGKSWAALAPSTLARYKQADKGARRGTLLERTRQLRNSLTSTPGDDYVDVGFSRLTDSGKWDVGQLHEFGTTRMPRRGLLTADPEAGELGAQDRADITAKVESWLDGLFAE